MATTQIGAKVEPQIIPTNAGYRTFAAPPQALQESIVPNDFVLCPEPLEGLS